MCWTRPIGKHVYRLHNETWKTPVLNCLLDEEAYGSITADLGGGFSFVGGLINYSVQGGSPDGSDPLIQALAADMSVLESYNLWTDAPIVTAGSNGAEFRGISRASSDIYYLRLVGAYSIIHSLEVGAAAVPEPATLALMGLGIAGLGFARKKTQA